MLNEQDIQAIGVLLDQKLKENKDEIVSEIGEATSEAFSSLENRFENLEVRIERLETKVDVLGDEMAKRPTKDEMFAWADRRIVDLEIGKERHDYLHIDELDKLPAPAEINKALVERGFKQKLA